MDRILLGKNDSGVSGFWASKPGVNVISYSSNGYLAGTEAGPEGLQDDGSVFPIYGFNENFSWVGQSAYDYDWVGAGNQNISSQNQSLVKTTPEGTILFNNNKDNGDPYFVHVMNTNPVSTGDGYNAFHREHTVDTSFNGNTYPLLEFRVRRPLKSDGTHWQISDFDSRGLSSTIFQWFFATSNNTNDNRSIGVPTGVSSADPSFEYNRRVTMSAAHWYDVMGTSGEWVTIEYDLANNTWQWQRDRGESASGPLRGDYHDWVSNTAVHMLRLDAFNDAQHPGQYPIHTRDDADLEVDYIRAKKRGVPINFGNSIDENFAFNSDWTRTGLIHQTGTVTIGTEYAWANGTAKPSGTSHPGSQDGRVDFPKLPYVPVVLFQRYDDSSALDLSFPAGDKEYSVAHCDITSNAQVWNPLTKSYQASTNTSYGSEFRTFAYSRASADHFDLTCRNAIARDGYEWLFNYTPQEPYVEIYKGGNYNPETENPESFVMYPQTSQAETISGAPGVVTNPGQPGTNIPNSQDHSEVFVDGTNDNYRIPSFDNGSTVHGEEWSPTTPGHSEIHPLDQITDPWYLGFSRQIQMNPYAESMPDPAALHIPSFGNYDSWYALPIGVDPQFTPYKSAEPGLRWRGNPSGYAGSGDDWLTDVPEMYLSGWFHDDSNRGTAFAGGRMKDGTLGIRRGNIITEDTIPTEGWDQHQGRGAPYPPTINATSYGAGGDIGLGTYTDLATALDYSARDYSDGKLGYFANYTGTDKGNCLPTFDWANKFGDWNVPQFNNFYQYDENVGAGSYVSFKDAIGTSWTEKNTKFLDDSMWLGYANNRNEYKGDIWHPQAPTKTYDEMSGVFGFGGTIKNQGDWAHFAGVGGGLSNDRNNRDGGAFTIHPQDSYLGIQAVSRYDAPPSGKEYYYNDASPDYKTPFHPHIRFRNRYGYRPGTHFNDALFGEQIGDVNKTQNVKLHDGSSDINNRFSKDGLHEAGFAGPGSSYLYGAPHNYGRMGALSPSHNLKTVSGVDRLVAKIAQGNLTPPGRFWRAPLNNKTDAAAEDIKSPSWTEPQTGYNGHKDSFVVSRWYTYPGATFAYDISNFSGPSHYDAWYKNDQTDEVLDYKRRDYPQLYSGGWGNYGYFPTQEQLDVGKGATRLFPEVPKSATKIDLASFYSLRDTNLARNWELTSSTLNYGSHFLGSFNYQAILPIAKAETLDGGTSAIYKKTMIHARAELSPADGTSDISAYSDFEVPFFDGTRFNVVPVRSYFSPNLMHLDKHVSRTFGIPNEIAGDYYVTSTRHNERGAHPDVPGDTHHSDTLLRHNIKTDATFGDYEKLIHTKEFDLNPANYHEYYHPTLNPNPGTNPVATSTVGKPHPDHKLIDYLRAQGVETLNLAPGEAIPIKADKYFAGMAFEGFNSATGAFNAHRFEFKIKKTKSHINHFRQSYEYNLPGKSPHRADTLRSIGYGLVTNHYGFDTFDTPPPAAHSYFDGRQLGGGMSFLKNKYDAYFKNETTGDLYSSLYNSGVIHDEDKMTQSRGSYTGRKVHPVNRPGTANVWFGATDRWTQPILDLAGRISGNPDPDPDYWYVDEGNRLAAKAPLGVYDADGPDGFASYTYHPDYGRESYETAYDRDLISDFANSSFYRRGYTPGISSAFPAGSEDFDPDPASYSYDQYEGQTGSAWYLTSLSTSISRHGRDAMVDGIIGAVEVSNTYSADQKARYFNTVTDQWEYWLTGADALPQKGYYALGGKTLKYRPAKSQGATPETQMYGAYHGAPWNRFSDAVPFFGGLGAGYTSTANYWEDDVLPGMCKADNALTSWGTVDLSKFDHNHIGYRWHNDAWHSGTPAEVAKLARSTIWAPSNSDKFYSEESGATDLDKKGYGVDSSGSGKTRITAHQKGGTYDGFKLHERPEFQPVSGDGRYFGGVGGVDNWGGTSYNTWGPGMCVTPTVWDLKWSSIQHPFGITPSAEQDANTFYGSTSIENQTSYIGGAPNVRVLLNDSGSDYDSANTWSVGTPPKNYDWAIGGHQIQSNHWDRTLKIKDLKYTDGSSGRVIQHANNGVQPTTSLKIKGAYAAGGFPALTYAFVLEDNTVVDTTIKFGWRGPVASGQPVSGFGDTLIMKNTPSGTEYELQIVDSASLGGFSDGIRVHSYRDDNAFRPIMVIAKASVSIPASDLESPNSPPEIQQNPQLVLYNKTLAEDPSRHPANAFKANTTYHFQYMYDETKIDPPKYRYWVLRIPAGLDAYNGENLL